MKGDQAAGSISTTRVNIEDVRVGDRVIAANPQVTDEERSTWIDPDWSDWRRAHLSMPKDDGGMIEIDLLRPDDWFEIYDVRPGESIDLQLPELGANGLAYVIDTDPCPDIKPGPGQVVTGTFEHSTSGNVLNVQFEGESKPIGVTDNHLFWSVERSDFVPIGKMELGERVQTFQGETKRIVLKLPRPGSHRVYNLEVYAEHVYFVGEQGLLVHNEYEVGIRRNPQSGKIEQRLAAAGEHASLKGTRWNTAPPIERTQSIVNGLEDHHTIPKFLGGFEIQELVPLGSMKHDELHALINQELKARGFGVANGGIALNASAEEWSEAFSLNIGMQKQALQAVLDASRKFDAQNGTNVATTMWNSLWSRRFKRLGW
jgi:hypothetical protein